MFSNIHPKTTPCHEADTAAGIGRRIRRGSILAKEQARSLLRALRDSQDEEEAERAMEALRDRITPDGDSDEEEDAGRTFSKLLVRLNGVPIILAALCKWHTSKTFASFATIVLMNMTFYEPKSRQCIADLGGIRLLMDTASYNDDLDLAADILLVFNNIANDKKFDLKQEVATDDCLSFVLDQMYDYSEDDILQRNACAFLENISCVPKIRQELEERGIPKTLSKTAESFRDKDSTVVEHAKNALKLIHGID